MRFVACFKFPSLAHIQSSRVETACGLGNISWEALFRDAFHEPFSGYLRVLLLLLLLPPPLLLLLLLLLSSRQYFLVLACEKKLPAAFYYLQNAVVPFGRLKDKFVFTRMAHKYAHTCTLKCCS